MSEDGTTRRELIARGGAVGATTTAGIVGVASAADSESDEAVRQVQRQPRRGTDGFGLAVVAGAAAVGGLLGGLLATAIQGRSGGGNDPGGRETGTARQRRRDRSPVGNSPAEETGAGVDRAACQACGADLPPGTNFCSECGEPV
jgi:hypothetical protein